MLHQPLSSAKKSILTERLSLGLYSRKLPYFDFQSNIELIYCFIFLISFFRSLRFKPLGELTNIGKLKLKIRNLTQQNFKFNTSNSMSFFLYLDTENDGHPCGYPIKIYMDTLLPFNRMWCPLSEPEISCNVENNFFNHFPKLHGNKTV